MRSGKTDQLKHLAWFQVVELTPPGLGATPTWNLEETVVRRHSTNKSYR